MRDNDSVTIHVHRDVRLVKLGRHEGVFYSFRRVLNVLKLKYNIFLVHLTYELDFDTMFQHKACKIKKGGTVIAEGTIKNGFFYSKL